MDRSIFTHLSKRSACFSSLCALSALVSSRSAIIAWVPGSMLESPEPESDAQSEAGFSFLTVGSESDVDHEYATGILNFNSGNTYIDGQYARTGTLADYDDIADHGTLA